MKMSSEALFLEFQQKWTKEKVQNMTLEEYTGIGGAESNRNDFTYWIEIKLKDIGSCRGGSSNKFGIYKSKNNEYKYAKKYGQTPEEAFKNIKDKILQIIDFSQNNELEKIDSIDLGIAYKWKIAFHYQKVDDMKILPILKEEAVKQIYKNEFGLELDNISEFHRKILPSDQTFTLEQVFEQGKKYWQKDENDGIDDKTVKRESKGINMEQNFPLNQILYGPPGTGKTYETINLALQILGENVSDKRDENKTKFDEYRQNGQIEFVTFHQSYGYEEFVEGIKPVFDDESGQTNEIKYEIRKGIFKKICENALENLENSQKSEEQLNLKINLEKIWNEYIAYLNEKISNGENVLIKENSKMKIINADEQTISISTDENNSYNKYLPKTIFMRDYADFKNKKIKSYKDIKPAYESKTPFHGNASYYFDLFGQISKFENESLKGKSETVTQEEKEKPYILIIDEINRGNISKIFGELITLIEESKRVGNSEELKVKLPYSGKLFGVPRNLYIIGTMNTADRSIALLDTALRRRFEFVEMMPKDEILKDKNIDGVNLQKLLVAINERIEYLLDREHTIGHAYFIGVEDLSDLKQVFKIKLFRFCKSIFMMIMKKFEPS